MTTPTARRCARPGCTGEVHAQGLCRTQYQAYLRGGLLTRRYTWVDPAPARARVAEHQRRGRTLRDLAALSGVDYSCLCRFLAGATHRVSDRTADRVLAVPLPPTAIGTQRRIRALSRIGHTWEAIAEGAGVPFGALAQAIRRGYFGAWLSVPVADVYERLSFTPGPSSRTRTRAERRGWATPVAWDDIDIDDPHAQPSPGPAYDTDPYDEVDVLEFIAGRRRVPGPKDSVTPAQRRRLHLARDEAIRRLIELGRSVWWTSEQVHCTPRTVERARAGRLQQNRPGHHNQDTDVGVGVSA